MLNDGRDKLMKVVQYLAKLYIWLNQSNARIKSKSLASNLSTVRKVIRIGHFLDPITALIDSRSEKLVTLVQRLAPLGHSIGIVNDMADDLICFIKLGLVGKHWLSLLTPLSDRLWYSGIFIDIHANVSDTHLLIRKYEKEEDPKTKSKLLSKISIARVSLAKLLADFAFCTIDVFQMKVSDGWQISAGLVAAVLGSYKLYVKNSS